jgi:endonuclease YncB( thermonuclease family)
MIMSRRDSRTSRSAGSSKKFTITGFLNIPEQRHFKGDPDGNTLWLWKPETDFGEVKNDLSLDSDLKIVKQGRARYPYLKVRFEGVDTPETHFNGFSGQGSTAGAVVKQNYGYLARDLLFQLLGDAFEGEQGGPSVRLECHLIKDGRYYDSHKRVIGHLYMDGQAESINMQMIESGYAFPMFYEAMGTKVIEEMRKRAKHAYDRDSGAWREYTVRPVDGSPPVPDNTSGEINDWGDVNYPKFWRRWISFNYDPNGRPFQTFVDWLGQRNDDRLAQGSKVKRFSDAVSPHDYRLRVMPWDLIFTDK